MSFPAPQGPYRVGSVDWRIVDTSRPAHIGSARIGRELYAKIWYPGAPSERRPELLWEELRADANVPRAFRYVLKAARTRTSTCPSAPLDRSARLSSVVVYNHGLISFASENTTLMEHLASCGHIVLALRHVEQMAELQALNRRDSASKRKADAEAARQLRMSPPEERARLAVEYYRQSVNTNLIVGERARDTSFVLDRLQEALQRVPGVDEADVDCDAIHAVGFSVGGAVATETAHRDGRVKSVTNLDGGFYGTEPPAPIRQPYLMMYSAANEGINDLLLPEHAVRRTPANTAHLNYHDVSVLLPFLRYTGVTGKVNPRELIVLRNSAVEAFIRAVDETSVSSVNSLPGFGTRHRHPARRTRGSGLPLR